MNRLEEDRKAIDEIDKEITELFEKRFTVVQDVIAYKTENDLPILNSGREDDITKKNTERIQNEDIRPYFKEWYKKLLALSRQYQQDILDKREEH